MAKTHSKKASKGFMNALAKSSAKKPAGSKLSDVRTQEVKVPKKPAPKKKAKARKPKKPTPRKYLIQVEELKSKSFDAKKLYDELRKETKGKFSHGSDGELAEKYIRQIVDLQEANHYLKEGLEMSLRYGDRLSDFVGLLDDVGECARNEAADVMTHYSSRPWQR